MPGTIATSRMETLEHNAIAKMDETVVEIFGMMLGMKAQVIDRCLIQSEQELISAIVGFAGAMSGCCLLQMHHKTALQVTGAMVGAVVNEVDNSVKDAVGELCNMIAGGWKNKLPGIGEDCLLSVPTVVTGENYDVHNSPNAVRYLRTFGFDGLCMNVTMLCEVSD